MRLQEVNNLSSLRSVEYLQQQKQTSYRSLLTGTSPVWTCLDVSEEWLILGTSDGTLFVFSRLEDKLLHRLVPKARGSEIASAIKLRCSVDNVVALGTRSGNIFIFVLPTEASLRQQIFSFMVTDVHHDEITSIEWSKNGMKLFTGDRSGCVVCTQIDYILGLSKSLVICRDGSCIIQLSHVSKTLLVSSRWRNFIILTNHRDGSFEEGYTKTVCIGELERMGGNGFGATLWSNPSNLTAQESHIIASRSDLSLCRYNLDGTLTKTFHIPRTTVQSDCVKNILLNYEDVTCLTDSFEFGRVLPFHQDCIVSYNQCGIFVMESETGDLLAYHTSLGRIIDLALCEGEVFVVVEQNKSKRKVLILSSSENLTESLMSKSEVSQSSSEISELPQSAQSSRSLTSRFMSALTKLGGTWVPVQEGGSATVTEGLDDDDDDEACDSIEFCETSETLKHTMDQNLTSHNNISLVTPKPSTDTVKDININAIKSVSDDVLLNINDSIQNVDTEESKDMAENKTLVKHDVRDVDKPNSADKFEGLTSESNEIRHNGDVTLSNQNCRMSEELSAKDSCLSDEGSVVIKNTSMESKSITCTSVPTFQSQQILPSDTSVEESLVYCSKTKRLKNKHRTVNVPISTSTVAAEKSRSNYTENVLMDVKQDAILSRSQTGARRSVNSTGSPIEDENDIITTAPSAPVLKLLPTFTSPTEEFHLIYSPTGPSGSTSDPILRLIDNDGRAKQFSQNSETFRDQECSSVKAETYCEDDADQSRINAETNLQSYQSIDQWEQSNCPGGHSIASLSLTHRHAFCTDKHGAMYQCTLSGPYSDIKWCKVEDRPARQVAVSPDGLIAWCLDIKGSVYAVEKVTSRLLQGQEWREVARDVAYIAVDNSLAWYIKRSGAVMVQTGLSRRRSSYRSKPVPVGDEFGSAKWISTRDGITWLLTTDNRILARSGVTTDSPDGDSWIECSRPCDSELCSVTVCSARGCVMVVDEDGCVWYASGVTINRPQGDGQWWRLAEYWTEASSTSEVLLVNTGLDGSIWLHTHDQSSTTWAYTIPSLYISWSYVTGYRMKVATPRAIASSTRWSHLSAVVNSNICDSVLWLQQTNGAIFVFVRCSSKRDVIKSHNHACMASERSSSLDRFCVVRSDTVTEKTRSSSATRPADSRSSSATRSSGSRSACFMGDSSTISNQRSIIEKTLQLEKDVRRDTSALCSLSDESVTNNEERLEKVFEVAPPGEWKSVVCVGVGGVGVWIVSGEDGELYRREGVTKQYPQGFKWTKEHVTKKGGVKLCCLSVGAECVWGVSTVGVVYVRRSQAVNYVLRSDWLELSDTQVNQTNNTCSSTAIHFSQISVTPNESLVYALDDRGKLYRREGLSYDCLTGTHWCHINGPGSAVALLSATNSRLYVVTSLNECFVGEFNGSSDMTWKKIPGIFTDITCNSNEDVWVLDRDKRLHKLLCDTLPVPDSAKLSTHHLMSSSIIDNDWLLI